MQSKALKFVLAIVALVVMAKIAMVFWGGLPQVDIPDELYGKWTTTEPRYEDRYFALSQSTVTFGQGDNGIAVYTLNRIQGVQETDQIFYVVTFQDDEGTEYSQSLFFENDDKDGLMFKNQKGVVWHKQDE
jgi:hypothetical protein